MEDLQDKSNSSGSSGSSWETETLEWIQDCPIPTDSSHASSSPNALQEQSDTPVRPVTENTETYNIPAPEPSTPQTLGSFIHERRQVERISMPVRPVTENTERAPGPSTPQTLGSFIHERRQVEHRSPPPTWPLPPTPTRNVPDTQGHQSLSQFGITTRDFGNSMASSPRPEVPPSAGAIRNPTLFELQRSHPEYFTDLEAHSSSLAAAFRQSSLRINTMRNVDPLASLAHLAQQQGQILAHSNPDPISGPSVDDTRGTTADSVQSIDPAHGGSETSGDASDHVDPSREPVGSTGSYVSNTASLPYALVENPVRDHADARDKIEVYHDLRVKPLDDSHRVRDDRIVIGSQIVFVGFTRWSNEAGEGVYDVGIPYGTQCVVAHIFNDHWAVCIKLDNGLELYEGDHSRRVRKLLRKQQVPKLVSLGGTPSVAVKPHPVVVMYAPLCAFTLAGNFGAFEGRLDATSIRASGLATWQGGTVQAANRAASSLFEDEARKAKKLYIPLQVWNKHQAYLSVFEQSINALDENMARAMVSANENAPPEGAPTSQDLSQASGRNKENISTGQQRRSFMSRSGTVRSVRKTVSRVKSVLKPESGLAANVPSNRIGTPQGTPHPTYGNPSGLAPRRTNIIPPIASQGALNPSVDYRGFESGSSRPMSPLASNVMSSTDVPLTGPSDNSNVTQRPAGDRILLVAREDAVAAGVIPSGAGATEGEPHPGTEVVPVRIIPNTEGPRRYDDGYVDIEEEGIPCLDLRNFVLPERRAASEGDTATRPGSIGLPSRLRNIIRGRFGQDAPRGAVGNVATLLRRHFAASADNAEPQEARLGRRSTLRRSLSKALDSVQPSRRGRRQSILPRDPGESHAPGIFDINPPSGPYQLSPRDEPGANVAPSGQHANTATNEQPRNPVSPSDGSLPIPGGLMDHLRRIAPDQTIRHRLRSSPSNTELV